MERVKTKKSFNDIIETLTYNLIDEMTTTGDIEGYETPNAFSGKGKNRVENTLVRSGQPKEVRQAYWDAYIEGKNDGGNSQTKFVDKDNFQIFPPVQPTGDLLRRERDTYWYGEWNPGYTPPS